MDVLEGLRKRLNVVRSIKVLVGTTSKQWHVLASDLPTINNNLSNLEHSLSYSYQVSKLKELLRLVHFQIYSDQSRSNNNDCTASFH